MHTILVAGIDSVVGANLAATLSDRHRIVGIPFSTPVTVTGCETMDPAGASESEVRHGVASVEPDWVIHCGMPAKSSWQHPAGEFRHTSPADSPTVWARAVENCGSRFAMISSDAIFTGPWMFHEEHSIGLCPSDEARGIRTLENEVREEAPEALIVRTHVYGWLPGSLGEGWVERLLSDLQFQMAEPADCVRHATPILATDFADILEQACARDLQGVYHVAGAERVSPDGFLRSLAEMFRLPAPVSPPVESLAATPFGFGRGETSLRTRRIRQALDVAMPTLRDGLRRLREQQQQGYCERSFAPAEELHEKVA